MADSDARDKGRRVRAEVLGKTDVEWSLAGSTNFTRSEAAIKAARERAHVKTGSLR